jgi:imidazolonepropionase-like amidohydrolase
MTIALNCARLFNGISEEIATDQVVVVEGNRIAAVGARASVGVPPDAQRIDLRDGTLLPGLIDLHAHPTYYFRRPDAAEYGRPAFTDSLITLFAVWQLEKDLAAGITTVRDVGAVNRLTHDVEKARQKGFVHVPRVCGSGRIITPTGGHVHDRLGLTHESDGVEGVRLAVREEIRAGAAFIKVAINGADFLCAEIQERATEIQRVANGVEFSQEELDVAVLEAHRAGLRVACHTRWRPAVVKAIQAGVDTIEHGTFMTDKDMQAIADKGIVWVPTIYQGVATIKLRQEKLAEAPNGFMNDGILSEESYVRRRHLFELALRLGVKIGAGTDIFRPEVNFAALVDEIEMFTSFGMSNAKAIQAGTRINAEAMGWSDRIGTVERGKFADLVVVEGDPLQDLNALRRPKLVMLDGSIVEQRL